MAVEAMAASRLNYFDELTAKLILEEADYANMRVGETKYLKEPSKGVFETVTYSGIYGSLQIIGVTKNLTGPAFSLGASAGLFKT
jgi:hypothetical protein